MESEMDLTCGSDAINFEENTYKHYYYPLSDDESSSTSPKLKYSAKVDSLDEFFDEEPSKKKKEKLQASTVARATADGVSYVSTNENDKAEATHLIKLEIYDLKKLKNVPESEHWKHCDVRIKYYNKTKSNHHQKTRQLIYNITKEISSSPHVKKFTFKSKK